MAFATSCHVYFVQMTNEARGIISRTSHTSLSTLVAAVDKVTALLQSAVKREIELSAVWAMWRRLQPAINDALSKYRPEPDSAWGKLKKTSRMISYIRQLGASGDRDISPGAKRTPPHGKRTPPSRAGRDHSPSSPSEHSRTPQKHMHTAAAVALSKMAAHRKPQS